MAAAEGTPPPGLKKRRSSITEPPSMSTKDTSLRAIIFGSSDHQQFSLTESILQSAVFEGADPHTMLTTKTSGSHFGRNVTLVNTPNLTNHDLLHYMYKKEVKKAVCFSCPGPHAILFTLNPLDMPPNAYEVFKPVVQYFGEQILNNTVIVLYHEEECWSQSLEDSVKKNKPFRELLEKCGQRYLIFSGKENRNEGEVTRKLFEEIDKMVAEHGIFSNVEFKDADKRIKAEEKNIQSQRKKEVSAVLEELQKTHSQEDLEREVKRYEEKIRLENRERAEVQIADRLGFTLRLVDYAAAIGKGAFVGAVLAGAMGFPGVAIGAAVGAALGGLLGGAAGAVWNIISSALADFGGRAT
ncbi:GTPase IMAP family member 9 [Ictalurus punctatus]|uniref:GTPase IMAP family member 9 n=1 Tax=Ictalurus punctatus TaxID=7998 RepID=A0A2D0PW05_ICTPU|nr:GTPase IMAP family member 9 [Ictalurus punctatus]XP_053531037.1 GTPase IMAP family member 9 [Ictalurus punctatus]